MIIIYTYKVTYKKHLWEGYKTSKIYVCEWCGFIVEAEDESCSSQCPCCGLEDIDSAGS
jgi:rubrerythrin